MKFAARDVGRAMCRALDVPACTASRVRQRTLRAQIERPLAGGSRLPLIERRVAGGSRRHVLHDGALEEI